MSFGDFEEFGPEPDDDEGAETPEIEQPEFETEFQTDISELAGPRIRTGDDRISPPYLGILAKARLIAARTGQLWQGARPLIPIGQLRSTAFEQIARQELEEALAGRITYPIRILRRFPNGWVEPWAVSDFKYVARD